MWAWMNGAVADLPLADLGFGVAGLVAGGVTASLLNLPASLVAAAAFLVLIAARRYRE
jgi:hypothetical protein